MQSSKVLSILFCVIIWQLLALVINSELFPSFVDIVKNLSEQILHKDLIFHLLITLKRVFISFVFAMVIGIVVGIWMGLFCKNDSVFNILLIIALNIPAIVTIMLCYIWFGLSDFAAILAVVINKVPIIVVNIKEGVKAVDKKYIDLVKIYNIDKKDVLKKIYLPQIYPYIMATTRLTISLIWKIVLVVEFLGRSNGVGFKISMFFQNFDVTSILSYSFAFILVVLLVEMLLNSIDKRVTRWR
jgi:NitT/TauT family transport system permease protein